ncbi:MAG: methyltransferase domain-containing protein [Candidatus Bathyarchaeota archaeon]|nr:methyltransferase domain-containing protein [Candidatus Bathyarchaeum sp.]
MSEELPKVFWEIHNGLPREGPGDNQSTRKAYMLLKDLPKNPRILDIGCGPGMQTRQLAKLSKGQIVALDFHQPFLEQLKNSARKEGLLDRIKVVNGTMFNLNYEDNSFDLIWSEGAIFVIGFEKGLREWRRLLAPDGYVVVSEMSWLQPDLPDEAVEFMKQVYPVIKTVEENLDVAQKSGYRIIDSFVLPSKSWWDNYYNWIEAKLPAMKVKHKDNKDALQYIACEETEIEMFRNYSDYYGYVFYILQVN